MNEYDRKFSNREEFKAIIEDLNRSLKTDYKFDKKILIVDDEPFNLMSLKFVLRACFKNMNIDPDLVGDITDQAFNG
mgnify:FL=1